ncbi:toll/interleukin-1 receptor domain-containing protein [Micromonospora vinacea]|uniref:toll/interleukin-1 receptor domain-containing protein n=1 Tax=Micromonospora vinacea TaxID=709878 RepID=UPI00344DAEC4
MQGSVRNEWQYDVFVSYARSDEQFSGRISDITLRIREVFRSLTGRELRLFLDREAISTASLWEQRIMTAVENSAILIAIQTPSYFTSQWCGREWDVFTMLEAERRDRHELRPYESLIFPILLTDATLMMAPSPDAHRRVAEMRKRQSINISQVSPQADEFTELVTRLVRDLVVMLDKVSGSGNPEVSSTDEQRFGAGTRESGRMIPLVATHSGADQQRFTRLLTEARAATIVGVANGWVADCLEAALTAKRLRAGPDTFWDHLHIVFLADDMLPFIHDEFSVGFPSRADALRERVRRYGQTKRRVMSLLLRFGTAGRWTLYTYPYLLPFVGNIFHLSDDRRVVQLAIPRPSRSENDNLYIDFLDRVDQYFESAFREVVEASREEHEVVLVGSPGWRPGTFICRSARFRRSVLVEGRNSDDWLAAVLVLTWRQGEEGPEPLLQVNTPHNSTREMSKASHVSGYVNQRDCSQQRGPDDEWLGEFEIDPVSIEAAVRRELAADFSIVELPHQPRLTGTVRFFYPDKENLFFYVVEQELPPTHRFTANVQMFPWAVSDLLTVRRNQVFSNALRMFDATMSDNQRDRAGRIVGLNLRAHGELELARSVADAINRRQVPSSLVARIQEDLVGTAVYRYAAGRELHIDGLAGLQYRAFFSHLVPAYVNIGIRGSAALLAAISNDSSRAEAVQELADLYNDGEFMVSIPIEV